MKSLRFNSKDAQKSIDDIIIGQELVLGIEITDPAVKKTSHASQIKLYGETFLKEYLASKEYDSVVAIVERSMDKREHDIYHFKSYASTMTDPKRIRDEGIRRDGIQSSYIDTVKRSSQALFTIANEAKEDSFFTKGIEILKRYEAAKEKTKGSFNFRANLGNFAYKTLLPLAPSRELVGFIFREYMPQNGIEGTMSMFRGTLHEKLAENYVREYSRSRKVA